MVLGYLLYEAVDLGVNVVKITYNGAERCLLLVV